MLNFVFWKFFTDFELFVLTSLNSFSPIPCLLLCTDTPNHVSDGQQVFVTYDTFASDTSTSGILVSLISSLLLRYCLALFSGNYLLLLCCLSHMILVLQIPLPPFWSALSDRLSHVSVGQQQCVGSTMDPPRLHNGGLDNAPQTAK